MFRRNIPILAATFAILVLSGGATLARTRTWYGGSSNNWNWVLNWSGWDVPDQNDLAQFNTGSADCNLDVDDEVQAITFTSGYTGTFNFASFTLEVSGGNVDMRTGGRIQPGTGTLELSDNGGTQVLIQNAGDTLPHILHSNRGTLRLGSDIVCKSFTQTRGTLDFNGFDITVVDGGGFTITQTNETAFSGLGGVEITVSGSASFTGQSGAPILMNPGSTWRISAVGALTANFATIANSDAGGGVTGLATNSTDGSGNTNWSFGGGGTVTWDGGGSDNNWGTAANWQPDGVPAVDDDVVFDGTSAKNCDLNGSVTVGSITLGAAYTGTVNFGADTLTLLTGGADLRSGGGFLAGSGALKLAGSGTQSLLPPAGDTLPHILYSGTGTLQLSTNDLFARGLTHTDGVLDLNGRNITIADGDLNVLNGSSSTFTGLGGRTITVVGDAYLCGQGGDYLNLTDNANWYIVVSGGLIAEYATLRRSNATGSMGAAVNCTDNNFNDRWVFGTKVWRGIAGTNWAGSFFGANWSPAGDPGPADVVIFNSNSSMPCVLNADPAISSIVFTSGYTQDFDFNGRALTISGSVANFSTGGTFSGTGTVAFSGTGAQSFIPKEGTDFPDVSHTGTGTVTVGGALNAAAFSQTANGTWEWGAGGNTHTVSSITATNGTLSFGNSTIEVTGNTDFDGLSAIDVGTGELHYTGTGTQTVTPDNGTQHPAITHSGTGTLRLATTTLNCVSFTNTAGSVDFGGQGITTTGNFAIINGGGATFAGAGLGGVSIIVGGNADLGGQAGDSLNMNPGGGWTINATGSLHAAYAVIAGSNAAGSEGLATNCRDGGGNTNWDFGNEVTPAWSRSLPVALTGGAMGEDGLYGSGATYLAKLSLADGGTVWSYNTGFATSRPTYIYSATDSKYHIVYSAGTRIGSVRDEGSGRTVMWGPTDVGSTAGVPYTSPDDNSFYVVFGDSLTKRQWSDGATIWTVYLSGADPDADLVVMNDAVYAANTSGTIRKFDADGTPGPSYAAGTGIDLPLLVSDDLLIATPATNRIHAVNAANMNQMWVSPVLADNCTGEALMLSGSPKIYVAAGTRVYRLTNNGNDASIDAGWPFDAGATVNSGPLPYRGKVFFGRTNGRYYALDDNTAGLVDQWPFSSVSGDGDIGPWIDVTNNRVLFASTGSDLHAFDVP